MIVNFSNGYSVEITQKDIERFISKVSISAADNCWTWNDGLTSKGYGHFNLVRTDKNIQVSAHRFSYSAFVGEITEKLCVLHRCDNRNCVNPAHLFLGTNKENTTDMLNKKRESRGDRHGKTIIKECQVEDILKFKLSGLTYKEISKIYGVSVHCIFYTVKSRARHSK